MTSARPDQRGDSNVGPKIQLFETGAAADQSVWEISVVSGVFTIRTRTNESEAGVDALTITRSGTSISSIGMLLAAIPDFADDAAAEAGLVPVGGFYRTASVLKIRAA